MKKIETSNESLLEVLAENGIEIICNDNMDMVLSDEDAEKVHGIVWIFAPAAKDDYAIVDINE